MGRRFAMNIFNLETNKVEIMEQGVGFFEDLRDVMNDIQSDGNVLKDAILKVRRRGTGKDDTSYRIDKEDVQPLSAEELAKFQEDSIKLDEYFKPHTNEQILRVISGEAWDEVMKSEQEEPTNTESEDFEVR